MRIVFMAIMMLLIAGCVAQKASKVEEIKIQATQSTTTAETQNETTSPIQTPSSQIEANESAGGLSDQIREAVLATLKRSEGSQ